MMKPIKLYSSAQWSEHNNIQPSLLQRRKIRTINLKKPKFSLHLNKHSKIYVKQNYIIICRNKSLFVVRLFYSNMINFIIQVHSPKKRGFNNFVTNLLRIFATIFQMPYFIRKNAKKQNSVSRILLPLFFTILLQIT